MKTATSLLAAGMMLATSYALAEDDIDLVPDFTPREPGIENFNPPDPEPPSYPDIKTDSSGEPRLHVTPDHSFGGSVSGPPDSGFQGNYRFPMPGGD